MTVASHRARELWSRAGARLYDPFLALGERRGLRDRRRALLAGARGRVLELGAGTGLNLEHYPPGVRELVLTEPDAAMCAALERRIRHSSRAAHVVAAPAEALPFGDGSFDTVVSTMVLCTASDPVAAIDEARRILRPGGTLLFMEHVRAADARLARRQERLAGAWAAFAHGCRCDRRTDALLAATLRVERIERADWRGMPSIVHPLVVGVARPDGSR